MRVIGDEPQWRKRPFAADLQVPEWIRATVEVYEQGRRLLTLPDHPVQSHETNDPTSQRLFLQNTPGGRYMTPSIAAQSTIPPFSRSSSHQNSLTPSLPASLCNPASHMIHHPGEHEAEQPHASRHRADERNARPSRGPPGQITGLAGRASTNNKHDKAAQRWQASP